MGELPNAGRELQEPRLRISPRRWLVIGMLFVGALGVGITQGRSGMPPAPAMGRASVPPPVGVAAPAVQPPPVQAGAGQMSATPVAWRQPAGFAPAMPPAMAAPNPRRAPPADPVPRDRPFHEVHWQGIELVPLTPVLAEGLGLPLNTEGVVIDQVSWPADQFGFAAGDVVTQVGGTPTPHLWSFVAAAELIRDQPETQLQVIRQGRSGSFRLAAERLGIANGETPPIIPPGAKPPRGCAKAHAKLLNLRALGPCENCHVVKTLPTATDLAQVLPQEPGPLPAPDPICRNQP